MRKRGRKADESVALAQGAYYLASGLWPLVHMASFERVTGAKADRWLVRTVGWLVASLGLGLARAGKRGRVAPELREVAFASAAGLAAIDVVTVARRRIPPVYLLDAVAEAGFMAGWALSRAAGSSTAPVAVAPRSGGLRARGDAQGLPGGAVGFARRGTRPLEGEAGGKDGTVLPVDSRSTPAQEPPDFGWSPKEGKE